MSLPITLEFGVTEGFSMSNRCWLQQNNVFSQDGGLHVQEHFAYAKIFINPGLSLKCMCICNIISEYTSGGGNVLLNIPTVHFWPEVLTVWVCCLYIS